MPDDLERHPIGDEPTDDDPLLAELRRVSDAIEQERSDRAAAFEREQEEREQAIEDEATERGRVQRKNRKRLGWVSLAVAADVILSLLTLVLWDRTAEFADNAEREAKARSRTVCRASNENRQEVNTKNKHLADLFDLSLAARGGEESLPPEQREGYRNYKRPIPYLDCERLVHDPNQRPLPTLPPGVVPKAHGET